MSSWPHHLQPTSRTTVYLACTMTSHATVQGHWRTTYIPPSPISSPSVDNRPKPSELKARPSAKRTASRCGGAWNVRVCTGLERTRARGSRSHLGHRRGTKPAGALWHTSGDDRQIRKVHKPNEFIFFRRVLRSQKITRWLETLTRM